jgi:1,2-diacylglycerol 3-beta-galactosyltransferase
MNKTKKRVLILSASAGFGHNSASRALAKAIQLRHIEDSTFHIANPLDYPKTPKWLHKTQDNYDGLARDAPGFYRFMYDMGNTALIKFLTEKVLFLFLYQTMKSLIRSYRPDVIINTYPLYNAALHAVCDKADTHIPTICVVTDLTAVHKTWFSPYNDLTVVPTEVTRDLAIQCGVPQDRVEIIGIPVDPDLQLESRSKLELREHLGWDRNLTTVLAVGSKRVTSIVAAVQALNNSNLPIQVVAIAGGDANIYNQLKETRWRIPTFIYGFVTEMPLFLRAADCVLSKSG